MLKMRSEVWTDVRSVDDGQEWNCQTARTVVDLVEADEEVVVMIVVVHVEECLRRAEGEIVDDHSIRTTSAMSVETEVIMLGIAERMEVVVVEVDHEEAIGSGKFLLCLLSYLITILSFLCFDDKHTLTHIPYISFVYHQNIVIFISNKSRQGATAYF